MIGYSHGYCIKTFKYFEDFKGNMEKNNKYLGYLRFVQFSGDLKQLCAYLNPSIGNLATAAAIRRKLRLPALSKENEKAALEKMKEIARKCLEKFPQSYDDDMQQLTNKALTFNERNCIIYRSGEKKVPPLPSNEF